MPPTIIDYLSQLDPDDRHQFANEIKEFIEMFDDPETYPDSFPLLRRIYQLLIEGHLLT